MEIPPMTNKRWTPVHTIAAGTAASVLAVGLGANYLRDQKTAQGTLAHDTNERAKTPDTKVQEFIDNVGSHESFSEAMNANSLNYSDLRFELLYGQQAHDIASKPSPEKRLTVEATDDHLRAFKTSNGKLVVVFFSGDDMAIFPNARIIKDRYVLGDAAVTNLDQVGNTEEVLYLTDAAREKAKTQQASVDQIPIDHSTRPL